MRATENIIFKGLDLSVTGEYYKGSVSRDYYTEDEHASFECDEITWNGIDVFDIFDALNELDAIDNEVLLKM